MSTLSNHIPHPFIVGYSSFVIAVVTNSLFLIMFSIVSTAMTDRTTAYALLISLSLMEWGTLLFRSDPKVL